MQKSEWTADHFNAWEFSATKKLGNFQFRFSLSFSDYENHSLARGRSIIEEDLAAKTNNGVFKQLKQHETKVKN